MGIFDKAREALHEHADKIDSVVDRAAGEADKRTGGQHTEHINRGADVAKDKLGEYARRDPAANPDPPA